MTDQEMRREVLRFARMVGELLTQEGTVRQMAEAVQVSGGDEGVVQAHLDAMALAVLRQAERWGHGPADL